MGQTIQKVATTDITQSNLWLGYVQGVATEKGQPLELTIPVPRTAIRELTISVCHDQLGKFMTAPQSAELTIPIEKLLLNHKFMPVSPIEGKNTMIYLSAEDSSSLTIHFNEQSASYFTSGKVAWR